MESIGFSQDELKIILKILNSINVNLADANVILPIASKIATRIHPEPPKKEETIPEPPVTVKN